MGARDVRTLTVDRTLGALRWLRATRRRMVLSVVAVLFVVAGGVYALAANLAVNTDTVGGGTSAISACSASQMTLALGTTADAGNGETVTTYTLGSVPAACQSKAYNFAVYDRAGASLATTSGTTAASASTTFTIAATAIDSIAGFSLTIADH